MRNGNYTVASLASSARVTAEVAPHHCLPPPHPPGPLCSQRADSSPLHSCACCRRAPSASPFRLAFPSRLVLGVKCQVRWLLSSKSASKRPTSPARRLASVTETHLRSFPSSDGLFAHLFLSPVYFSTHPMHSSLIASKFWWL